MALFGPPDVSKLQAKRDVEGLIRALAYPKDPLIRRAAAEALGELGATAGIAPLQHALWDDDGGVRLAAIKALGRTSRDADLLPLVDVLVRGEAAARAAATAVLFGRGGATVFQALFDLARNAAQPAAARAAATEFLRARQDESLPVAAQALFLPLPFGPASDGAAILSALEAVYGPAGRQFLVEATGTPQAWDPGDGEHIVSVLRDLVEFARYAPALELLSALGVKSLSNPGTRPGGLFPEAAALVDSPARKRLGPLLGDADDVAKLRALAANLVEAKTPGAILFRLPDLQRVLPLSMEMLWHKSTAVTAIGSTQDQALAPPVIAHLAFSPAYNRAALARHIAAQVGEPTVADAIATGLLDAHKKVLADAARALGSIGGGAATSALCSCVTHEEVPEAVKRVAVAVLGTVGRPEAVPAIERYLTNAHLSREDARAAIHALGQIRDRRSAEALVRALDREGLRSDAVTALKQNAVEEVVPRLLTLLNGPSKTLRATAADALGVTRGQSAEAPLVAALADSCKEVRLAAADALERRGWQPANDEEAATYAIARGQVNWWMRPYGQAAVRPLGVALSFEEDVAVSAAGWLGAIGGAAATETLLHCVEHGSTAVRCAIVKALGAASSAAAIPVLILALQESALRSEATEALARTLGQCGDANVLVDTLSDPKFGVRRAAADILAKVGWQPRRDEDGAAFEIACDRFAAGAAKYGACAAPALIAALTFSEADARQQAAQVLGTLRSAGAVESLLKLAKSAHDRDRAAAFGALAGIEDKRAIGVLVTELASGSLNVEAVAALARLGAIGAIPGPVIDVQTKLVGSTRDRDTRTRAALALCGMYRSGQLPEHLKNKILAVGPAMSRPHDDHTHHWDHDGTNECSHSDETTHSDAGIGIAL